MRASIIESGPKADFSFRYSFGNRDLFEPFTGPDLLAGSRIWRHGQATQPERDGRRSPMSSRRTFVNETRVALSRVAASVTQEASRRNPDLGLPVISPNARDAGLSFITVTGSFAARR